MLNATVNKSNKQTSFRSLIFEQNFPMLKTANYQMPLANSPIVKTIPNQIKNSDSFILNKEPSNNDLLNASIAVGTAGTLSVAQIFVRKLSEVCSHLLMAGREFTSGENVKKVANAILSKEFDRGIQFADACQLWRNALDT